MGHHKIHRGQDRKGFEVAQRKVGENSRKMDAQGWFVQMEIAALKTCQEESGLWLL